MHNATLGLRSELEEPNAETDTKRFWLRKGELMRRALSKQERGLQEELRWASLE